MKISEDEKIFLGRVGMGYFQDLLNKIAEIRCRFVEAMELNVKSGDPIIIDGIKMSTKKTFRACLQIITKEPKSIFWNWDPYVMTNNEERIKLLRKLEQYLLDTPGAKLPTKDQRLKDLMEKRVK